MSWNVSPGLFSTATNIIVTGIPRSGTTLVAALIDRTADSLCLSEPPEAVQWIKESPTAKAYARRVVASFDGVRSTVLSGGTFSDMRAADGAAVTNYADGVRDGRRAFNFNSVASSRQGLSNNFLLAIKHNTPFAAVLPDLVQEDVPLFAMVRHPISVLLSWLSLDLPFSRAQFPDAERFWPEINEAGLLSGDRISAMAASYEMFCARFLECRVPILKYEDLLADPDIIARLFGRNPRVDTDISDMNANPLYDYSVIGEIRSALEKHGRALFELYPDTAY
jgi:Sulfotransferase family